MIRPCVGRLVAVAVLAFPLASAAQQPGRIELGVFGRYTWMSADRPIDNPIGIGGALGLFLTQRLKLTADASYSPSELSTDGSSVGYVALHSRIAYELPLSDRVRAVAGTGWVLNLYRDDGLDDTGIGSAAGLKWQLSERMTLGAQVTHDWMPPWLNPRTFVIQMQSPATVIITQGSDVHMGLEAGISARLGGGRDQPAIVAVATPTQTAQPVTEPPRQTAPPVQQPQPQPQRPATQNVPQEKAAEPAPPRYAMLQTIYFDFDKSALRPEAREQLTRAAAILRANPDAVIVLQGHADERGADDYNLALGRRRAAAARAFLLTQGVEERRLLTASEGERMPADPAHNPSAYSRNRRVEFTVQGGTPLREPGRQLPQE
jgi:peptidoglycan-associated lipoprotein